jgi:hypothetical protein
VCENESEMAEAEDPERRCEGECREKAGSVTEGEADTPGVIAGDGASDREKNVCCAMADNARLTRAGAEQEAEAP